ncbi:MAG: response regulator [Pelovirga sp.]
MKSELHQEILLEIALSISGEFDLSKLLKNFLTIFQRKLNCTFAAVINTEHGKQEPDLVLPRMMISDQRLLWALGQAGRLWKKVGSSSLEQFEKNDEIFYFFTLDGYGILILCRQQPLDGFFQRELRPLTRMLSRACLSCLEVARRHEVEIKLVRQQKLIDAIVDHAPIGIWVNDPRQNLILTNRYMKQQAGLGTSETSLTPAEVRVCKNTDRQALDTDKPFQCLEEITFKDGRRHVLQTIKTKLYNDDGSIMGVLGLGVDVTEAKQAEKEILRQKSQFESLFTSTNDAMVYFDTSNRIFNFNVCFAEMFEHNKNALVGADLHAVVDPLQQEQNYGVDLILAGGTIEREVVRVTRSGRVLDLLLKGGPVYVDGEITGGYAIYADISERKTAEHALQQQSRLQQILMEISSVYINLPLHEVDVAIQRSLRDLAEFVDADRAYIFHYDFNAGTTSNTYEWCNKGTTPQIDVLQEVPISEFPDWLEAHTRGYNMYIPDVSVLPDGGLRRILEPQQIKSLLAVPMMNGDRCIGFVGFDSVRRHHQYEQNEQHLLGLFARMMVNVRLRKEAEQQLIAARDAAEAASRSKSEFLANMSHEIRTPLNGVVSMLSLLEETELSAEQREYLEVSQTSAESLMGVINDILDFSRIEAGRLELSHQDFDLEQEIYRLMAILSGRARDKQIEMLVHYAAGAPRMVTGDNLRLRQILFNIAGNAVKFTEQGHILLDVCCTEQTATSARFQLSVKDTGIGIPADKLEEIFDHFTQADYSSTRRFGGTGLGLAISRQLVQLMGGELKVESILGEGSTFYFDIELPLAQDVTTPLPLDALTNAHVLVVDDNDINRRILAEYLDHWGMTHTLASSAYKALAQLEDASAQGIKFDLALIDHAMPGMDGLELAHTIRRNPHWGNMALIAISSFWGQVGSEAFRASGFNAFLPKPINRSDLLNQILSCLSRLQNLAGGAEQTEDPESEPVITRGFNDIQPKILLVEDHPVNRKSVQVMLKKITDKIICAHDGSQALDLFDGDFDVVLMDVQMPVMDGLTATREIRAKEQQLALPATPIIALTANAMSGDREKCMAAGMTDYLSKPVKKTDLIAMIEKYLPRKDPDTTIGVLATDSDAPDGSGISPSSEVIFNATDFLHNYDEDLDTAAEIMGDFLNDLPTALSLIRTAVKQQNMTDIDQQTHKLKGSAGYVGAESLRQTCIILAQVARQQDWVDVGVRLQQLHQEATALKRQVCDFFSARGKPLPLCRIGDI